MCIINPFFCFIFIIGLISIPTIADFTENFSSKLTNDPDGAYLLLTNQYNNSSEALDYINRYILNNRGEFGAYGVKGWILNDLNRYVEALGTFDMGESISGHKIDLMSFFLSGRAHSLYGLKQYSEALTRSNQAINNQNINIYGGNLSLAEALTVNGMSHFEMAEYEEALKAFQQANENKPEDPNILLNIGNCYYKLNNNEEALKAYDNSIKIEPGRKNLYYKGLVLRNMGDYKEAIDTFKEALKFNPDDEEIIGKISETELLAKTDTPSKTGL